MEIYGGNAGYDRDGTPFLFDPASYYGDREADIAFTACLAGFHRLFMMPMKENIQSTEVFANGKPSTTSTMNSIISIYSVVAMETLPSLA